MLGADVGGVFLGGEVFAEGTEEVLDAVGGAGVANDLEEREFEFVLEAFEAAVVIDEVEEGFFGVSDGTGDGGVDRWEMGHTGSLPGLIWEHWRVMLRLILAGCGRKGSGFGGVDQQTRS